MADIGSIDFASLLCSRMCHDLLNPVGALNNGLELLADETDPGMREQCFSLLTDSARTTAAKLRFFRIAFGSAGGLGETIPSREIKDAVEGMFSSGKLAITWMPVEDNFEKVPAKILLNLALIGGEALPRGGTLTLGLEKRDGAFEVAVQGEGPRLTLDQSLRDTLLGKDGDALTSTRTVTAAMVRQLVMSRKGEIVLSDPSEPFFMFGARVPA